MAFQSALEQLMLTMTIFKKFYRTSVQFSCSVVSDCLRPHELQYAGGLPSMGSHRVGHDWSDLEAAGLPVHHQLPEFTQTHVHRVSDAIQPAISSSVVPFSSCPQSLPASESFPMSQLLAWGGQTTRVSALASFLPKKPQGWSPSEWTGWISLQSKGLSRVFSNITVQKHQNLLNTKMDLFFILWLVGMFSK